MLLTLYSMPGTCALSVHIALEWADIPYQAKVLKRGENRRLDYLQINPLGSVPALVLENGGIMREASALLTYIDCLNPEAFRAPGHDAIGRARLAEVLSFLTTELHAAFAPHFAPGRFIAEIDQHSALRHTAYARLQRLLDLTDDSLTGPYVFGNHRSVVDPYLYVIAGWIGSTPLELNSFPLLAAFKRRMDTDTAVMKALAEYPAQT